LRREVPEPVFADRSSGTPNRCEIDFRGLNFIQPNIEYNDFLQLEFCGFAKMRDPENRLNEIWRFIQPKLD